MFMYIQSLPSRPPLNPLENRSAPVFPGSGTQRVGALPPHANSVRLNLENFGHGIHAVSCLPLCLLF